MKKLQKQLYPDEVEEESEDSDAEEQEGKKD